MPITWDLPDAWRKPLVALILLAIGSVLTFYDSWRSIVEIWIRSDTFAHGFLVAPVSLWLILSRKNQLRHLSPAPSYAAIAAMAGCGFVWLAAELSQVLVVKQFALVGGLVCGFWAMLGTQVALSILFPLMFLFLMVPFGEDFVPYLMEFTATFTVWMLRLTGISVYREGLHFTLTSGNWSVVDACSGIRYLIASITLGTVYAYLSYTHLLKRAAFMLLAVVVPIFANGLRAYMIVMIGHLSDMKLATGVDHIIYGWLFFGLVMLLLFYLGSFWQDPPLAAVVEPDDAGAQHQPVDYRLPFIAAAAIGLVVWPLLAGELLNRQKIHFDIPLALLDNIPNAVDQAPDWGWQPKFKGVMIDAKRYSQDGDETVAFYAANFGDESQGGELINSQNFLVAQNDHAWRVSAKQSTLLQWADGPALAEETQLTGLNRDLLVLRWYRIGGSNTANPYYAKWLQLRKRLTADAAPELMIVLYTETPHGNSQQARERLIRLARACCG